MIVLALHFSIEFFLPYYYGNELFAKKLAYYNKHQENYNTVIFGSSRMYRQVIPDLLDSILIQDNISSFNFASQACFNPESYYLYENFIE